MNRVCTGLPYLEKKYFQNKAILFFSLCWFLPHSVLAEPSDPQQMEFVEQLAQPFSEKKVFYKWVSEKSWKMLIEAGEWTPELYEHYMDISRGHPFGPGFYVSEYISSTDYTSNSRNALIQIEVEPNDLRDSNYKYLDLSQREIQNVLKERNIDVQELLNSGFNLQIAIKYSSAGYNKWIFRGRKGMRFRPFSSRDMSLYTLEKIYSELPYDKQVFLKTAIQADILNREKQDPAILSSPFIKIIEEVLGRVYVLAAIYDAINSPDFRIKTIQDAIRWLKNTNQYISVQDEKKLAKAATNLPINSAEEAIVFLILANKYLSAEEIRRIVLRTPTRSVVEEKLLKPWLPSPRSCHNGWTSSRSF